ncbi:MAG: FAD-binding oxidoreductase [Clostridia bacterium]|nr:FAD-binding oxidoreductase [Clostridia bacterium]
MLIQPFSPAHAGLVRDESRTVGYADSVSFPRSHEQVTQIVRSLYQDGIPFTVQGARTGLTAAAVPFGGHILNVTRMNRILGLNRLGENGFSVSVQPGVPLCELRKALSARRFDHASWSKASLGALSAFMHSREQFFPPDPTETTATLGGMVSCNASGARSYRYGATRPYVLAVRAVLPDGRSLSLRRGECFADGYTLTLPLENGSRLTVQIPQYIMPKTKNTAGYFAAPDMDAVDLLVGSDGTLCVFTELELQLLPLPACIQGVTCLFETEIQAAAFVQAVREQVEGVVSLEYFDEGALAVLRDQRADHPAFASLPPLDEWIGAALYVELHGDDEAFVTDRLNEIGDLLSACGGDPAHTWVARTQTDLDRLMFFRHAVPESVNLLIDRRKQAEPGITKLGSDMAVPDEHLDHILTYYRQTTQALGLHTATWGHIGNNHLHVNVLPRNLEEYTKGKALFNEWAHKVTALNGAVSAEHGVGKLKAGFLTAMYSPESLAQMRAVKAAFDPKLLLGRGNLFAEKEESR